jgi:outer membrane protein assembly factor BamB
VHRRLAPDTHTPVATAGRVFGVWRRLFCLDAGTLAELWASDDPAFGRYCAAVASADRVFVLTVAGKLILLDATAGEFGPLARLKLFAGEGGVYAHPAVVGNRVFVRGGTAVACLEV